MYSIKTKPITLRDAKVNLVKASDSDSTLWITTEQCQGLR